MTGLGDSQTPHPPARVPEGRTIFVVEDDELVRKLTVKTLTKAGYRVFHFASGPEALSRLDSYEGEVPLLLTDVVMLGMNGGEVARRFLERHPTARVLLMSGYADEVLARTGVNDIGRAFLEKPFTPALLLDAVRAEHGVRSTTGVTLSAPDPRAITQGAPRARRSITHEAFRIDAAHGDTAHILALPKRLTRMAE